MDNAERCLNEAMEASNGDEQVLAAFGTACSNLHKISFNKSDAWRGR